MLAAKAAFFVFALWCLFPPASDVVLCWPRVYVLRLSAALLKIFQFALDMRQDAFESASEGRFGFGVFAVVWYKKRPQRAAAAFFR